MPRVLALIVFAVFSTACGADHQEQSPAQTQDISAHDLQGGHHSDVYHANLHGYHPHALRYRQAYPHYGHALNRRYGVYNINVNIQHDARYLRALERQATAALIRAKAVADSQHAQAAAIRALLGEFRQGLNDLRSQIKQLEAQQSLLTRHGKAMDDLALAGTANATTTKAIQFYMRQAGGVAVGSASVSALAADQFISRGGLRVEVGPDGVSRFVANEAKAFPGGNAASFIKFLKDHRQDVKPGTAAHAAILALQEQLAAAGEEQLAANAAKIEQLRGQQQARWQSLADFIAQLNEVAPESDD